MKLIKLAAAALITLSSLSAQAGLMYIDGGVAVSPIPNNNDFKAFINPGAYNIGGNLKVNQNASVFLTFDFLDEEAGWTNTFKSEGGFINNTTQKSSFSYAKNYSAGDLISFSFDTNGSILPNIVWNGANNNGNTTVSFAVALDTMYKGVMYDAILFFDDTGGYQDDDNHDDLLIGIKAQVPESSTFVLMLMGLAGLFAARRMKA